MSTEPENIEIEITDQVAPEKDDIEVVKVDDDQKSNRAKEIDPEEGLESLRKKLEDERQARINAEKVAQEASEKAYQATNEAQDVNLQLVKNAIDTLSSNSRMLKSEYANAMAVGDYDRAAEIQESMSENTTKLVHLQQGRTAMESKPREKPPELNFNSDPVEKLASALTPRSAEWIRRNPDYAKSPRLYQKMVAAHNLVVADEIQPDTDEYFSRVENILGIGGNQSSDNHMSSASKPTQHRSPPAAPVSRSGNGTGNRPNVVRLTAQEREIAKMMDMSDQEYARNKLFLQKEGKLN